MVYDIVEEEKNRAAYAEDYACFHAQLEADAFRKIVLARSATIRLKQTVDPKLLFWKACQLYPRLFIALVSLPDGHCWLTATPEILLEGVGQDWRTIALAGTMQLKGDELKGEGENMCWSTKNIQEQRYVATYIAECLKRFSLDFHEEGPRTVRAANLVHLRSDFPFILNDVRAGELLEMLHPTPAVCGLPKQGALNYIVAHEHLPREYYSGFMGPFNMDGATHLYVSLRCMRIHGTECRLYAGGGLLKDSCLEQEWQETEAKMQTMRFLMT
jgi:isochorismate synthase